MKSNIVCSGLSAYVKRLVSIRSTVEILAKTSFLPCGGTVRRLRVCFTIWAKTICRVNVCSALSARMIALWTMTLSYSMAAIELETAVSIWEVDAHNHRPQLRTRASNVICDYRNSTFSRFYRTWRHDARGDSRCGIFNVVSEREIPVMQLNGPEFSSCFTLPNSHQSFFTLPSLWANPAQLTSHTTYCHISRVAAKYFQHWSLIELSFVWEVINSHPRPRGAMSLYLHSQMYSGVELDTDRFRVYG